MNLVEREIWKLELANGRVPLDVWFEALGDKKLQAAVDSRLARVRAGNFGDYKAVGGGGLELRVDIGPGLRVYFALHGLRVVVLIGGGDKTTKRRDIGRA